jgi:PAS domain S-box-containing protein
MADADSFRWQALFQRADEPLFLLDRQRRILFVNQAWEKLTGVPRAEAHGKRCRRVRHAEPGSWQAIGHAFAPPPEALHGRLVRVRRLLAGAERRWCDVEFLPFRTGDGLLALLGKVIIVPADIENAVPPLPEKLLALRERLAERYRLDAPASRVPALRRAAAQVRLASQSDAGVCIVGEKGTGKEWTARVIHHTGTARARPFAAVDCARLPPAALVHVLFGHGGLTRRDGIGTLYLKEPARLPRDLQTQLCDSLGDEAGRPRIIAGAARNPLLDVEDGRLVEELSLRLSALVVSLPPLRERRDDLALLVERFLERLNTDEPQRVTGLTAEAWEVVRDYRWPGNGDELFAVLASARGRAKSERIDAGDVPAYLRQTVSLEQTVGRSPERAVPLDPLLEQVERRLILLALRATRGNRSRAAELLDISRPRLIRRIEVLKIDET